MLQTYICTQTCTQTNIYMSQVEVDKYEIATCVYQDTHIYTQSHTTTYTQTNIYVTGWGLPGRVH